MKRRLIASAIAATGVFAASAVFASPATAATESPIEQFDTPAGVAYSIDAPAVDAETLQLLQQHGLSGVVDELQYDETGSFATYVVDDAFAVTYRTDQSRVVSAELVESADAVAITETAKNALVMSDAQPDATARAAEWGWGVCTGSFNGSRTVNNTIEWGGVSTCEGTPTSVYPHSLSVDLYSTCIDAWCVVLGHEATINSRGNDHYSRVATAVRSSICSGGAAHIFEQKATINAGGIERGTAWQRDVQLACSDLIH